MHILVVADHDNQAVRPSTLATVAAAKQIGRDVDILIAGSGCAAVGEAAAKISGVFRVLVADNQAYRHQLAENIAELVAEVGRHYSHIMTAHTATGRNFLPRVAGLLDVAMISDIIGVVSDDTFERPIYAGNAVATVRSSDRIKIASVRVTAFNSAPAEGGSASVENIEIAKDVGLSSWIKEDIVKQERPDLTQAKVVISGGRGMQSGENFRMLEQMAIKLGAAVGASRAAVDAGFVSNDLQVGQTGKIVAPELYIAVGISGAIQHLAGMKDSKVIVAINKDKDARIFEVADYGLVADLFKAVPELNAKL